MSVKWTSAACNGGVVDCMGRPLGAGRSVTQQARGSIWQFRGSESVDSERRDTEGRGMSLSFLSEVC